MRLTHEWKARVAAKLGLGWSHKQSPNCYAEKPLLGWNVLAQAPWYIKPGVTLPKNPEWLWRMFPDLST